MKKANQKMSKKFKVLASVLGIVLGVTAVFAPACSVKGVDDTYVNDKGELVIVYTDGTEKNLGVVKGEDGKDGANGADGKDGIDGIDGTDGKDGKDGIDGSDGKDGIDGVDGKDLTACVHEYDAWQTEIEATCTSIGYDTRTCALCGDLDYSFNEAGSHNFDLQNAVSVMGDCTERWVNASCKTCGDTTLKKVSNFHFYDENGVCTECGYQADVITETNLEAVCSLDPRELSVDSTATYLDEYGNEYTLFYNYMQNSNAYRIIGIDGEPVSIRLHEYHNGIPITTIYGRYSTSYTPVEYGAFNYADSLEKISLPNTITNINRNAFRYSSALTEITIPESVTSIGANAFYYCTSLIEITIPKGVTEISISCFSGCTSLTEITIPESVTSISDFAFAECSSLVKITIPPSVTFIGYNAFVYTAYFNNYSEDVVYLGDFCIGYKNEPTSVTIKEGTKCLVVGAFKVCTSLTEIIIPESVTTIESEAFFACTSLTEITIPKSVTTIESEAFFACYSLVKVNLHEGVTEIESRAFGGCTSLTHITIPDCVTSIDSEAFYYCSSLTEITIPQSVDFVRVNIFSGCSSLKEVKVHSSDSKIYLDLTYSYPNINVVYYD